MATNGAQEAFAPDDVLAAVMTMRGGEQESKKKAHEYLERFQKSVRDEPDLLYASPFHDLFLTSFDIERFMGHYLWYPAGRGSSRGDVIRGNNTSRQGQKKLLCRRWTMDYSQSRCRLPTMFRHKCPRVNSTHSETRSFSFFSVTLPGRSRFEYSFPFAWRFWRSR
jgi:hypothetical protein